MWSKKILLCAIICACCLLHFVAAGNDETTMDEMFPSTTTASPIECGAPENFRQGTFTLYDYSVVLGMLVISLGIGK